MKELATQETDEMMIKQKECGHKNTDGTDEETPPSKKHEREERYVGKFVKLGGQIN